MTVLQNGLYASLFPFANIDIIFDMRSCLRLILWCFFKLKRQYLFLLLSYGVDRKSVV